MLYLLIILASLLLIVLAVTFNRVRNRRLLCSVSAPHRGTESERNLVVRLLKKGVNPKAIFHDLYLKRSNGEYAQIDLVVALPQGLVCIEVKDYRGWIYGADYQRSWTQLLNYGKEKNHFYNPIMQNAGHIRALREQSAQLARLPIYNVVLFTRNGRLKRIESSHEKTYVDYTKKIKSILKKIRQQDAAYYSNKLEVVQILRQAVCNGDDPEIIASHIESVQKLIRKQHLRALFRRILRWLIAILA